MKTINYKKFGLALLGLVILALTVTNYIYPEFGIVNLVGIGGVLASVPVIGTPTSENTETNASGHRMRDISTIVTEIKPDEFPLDTMIRKIRKAKQAVQEKVEFETVTYRERDDTVTTLNTAAGSAADDEVDLIVGKINIWAVDDIAYLPSIVTGITGGKGARLHVKAINRGTSTITVSCLNATTGTRVPTIAATTPIYRGSNAKSELDSTNEIITQLPTQDYNYTQIQMAYIERSKMSAKNKAYSGYSHEDKVRQAMYDLRSSCEFTSLFGVRSKFTDDLDGDVKFHAGGVESFINTTVNFGTGSLAVDPDLDDILQLLETTFSGNAGSSDRLLLAGKSVLTGLQKVTFDKNQMAMETAIVHGVKVSKLESNFGTLNIKHSKMLDQQGWSNKAMVLDLEHVYKHDLEPMHKEVLDPDKAGTRRVQDAVRYLENSCITLRYAAANDPVHLIWAPAA